MVLCILLRLYIVIVFLILPTEVQQIFALVKCQAPNDIPDLHLALAALPVIPIVECYVDYSPFGKVLLGLDEQKRDAYDVALPVYSQ